MVRILATKPMTILLLTRKIPHALTLRLDQHGPAIKMFGDTEHIIEPVTMPRAANNKRADTTGGTVDLDLGVACKTVMTREVGASTNI